MRGAVRVNMQGLAWVLLLYSQICKLSLTPRLFLTVPAQKTGSPRATGDPGAPDFGLSGHIPGLAGPADCYPEHPGGHPPGTGSQRSGRLPDMAAQSTYVMPTPAGNFHRHMLYLCNKHWLPSQAHAHNTVGPRPTRRSFLSNVTAKSWFLITCHH